MERHRRTFLRGKLEKGLDLRLVPDGAMTDAMNILVSSSEGNDVGAVENVKGNEKLTNLNLTNAVTIGVFANDFYEKIYYFITSEYRDLLVEYDKKNHVTDIVLESSRPNGVLDLDKKKLITGIVLIINGDSKKDLIGWTDDNKSPRLVNIERAKTYGLDGFEEEDISLIKKPPRYAPRVELTYTPTALENYLEDRFLCFAYRYKYLDGEYSALSTFSNVAFEPKNFTLDPQTYENNGMVNSFNAARIVFNTGSKRVTDIELVYKETNSNTIYVIERFNKSDSSWEDDEERSFLYSNNKTFTVLPSDELNRLFDNVPRKAKSLSLVGNRLVLGNYLEGYDLKNEFGEEVVIDFNLFLYSKELYGEGLNTSVVSGSNSSGRMNLDFTGIDLKQGTRIGISVTLKEKTYNDGSFNNDFEFILNEDFSSSFELSQNSDFIAFVETVMTNSFNQSNSSTPPDNSEISTRQGFKIHTATQNIITLRAPSITYKIDDTPTNPNDNDFTFQVSYWDFTNESLAEFSDDSASSSLKTNRSYEIVQIYMDGFNRSTTGLNCKNNTLYIPQEFSTKKNKIRVQVNHRPPEWADRYKFAIKQNKFDYETIYANVFYEDGPYRWVKVDGANLNKVKEGDDLIVKSDSSGPVSDIIKVRVLEVSEKERDFIEENKNEDDVEIIESSGLYMKIKPVGFSLENRGGDNLYYTKFDQNHSPPPQIRFGEDQGNFGYMDEANQFQFYEVRNGARITIFIETWEKNRGDNYSSYNKTFTSGSNYVSFQEWFDEEVGDFGDFDDEINWEFREGGKILFIQTKDGGYGWGGDRRLNGEITLLNSSLIIFETSPKEVESNIFYECSDIFDIEDGFHKGNLQDQTVSDSALVELDAFNCFVFGNGVESYKIKDAFNEKFLNMDTRPTGISEEKYSSVRRFADFTWGGPYVESSNINKLNEFNLSTGNFFERLEKQYGPIQITKSRDTDMLVWQEDKVHRIPFQKDILYGADGQANVKEVDDIFGRPVPYYGEFGISNNPESLSSIDREFSWVDSKRQVVLRLTNNGIFPTSSYGMVDFFHDILQKNIFTKKVSSYDPFNRNLLLSIEEEPTYFIPNEISCNDNILVSDFNGEHEIYIDYGIKVGEAGIYFEVHDVPVRFLIDWDGQLFDSGFYGDAQYNSQLNDLGYSNVVGSGPGVLKFDKTKNSPTKALITVIAPVPGARFRLFGRCVITENLTVVSVILNDEDDVDKTIVSRYKWINGGYSSPYKNYEIPFDEDGKTLFGKQTGQSGNGEIPSNGSDILIEAYQGYGYNGQFLLLEENRLGYLVSDIEYNESQIEQLLNNTNFINVTQDVAQNGEVLTKGVFNFQRPNNEKYLYLIWDYVSKNKPPIAVDDNYDVQFDSSLTFDVRVNDSDPDNDPIQVIIVSQPSHGDVVVNPNGSVTYTHDGSDVLSDSFTYKLNDGSLDSNVATVSLNIINEPPVANDDAANVDLGESVTISVLSNDYDPENDPLQVILVTQPQYGVAVVNPNGTITYTHNNSANYLDSFTYKLSDGINESNVATVDIAVGVDCSAGISASGGNGVYEVNIVVGTELGETGISYNAQNVPDRFQLVYDGVVVADSKYVGGYLDPNSPYYNPNAAANLVGTYEDLDVYEYNGSNFVTTGEKRTVTVNSGDIASGGANEPQAGMGVLTFVKTTEIPTIVKLLIYGPDGGTAWSFAGICPTPLPPADPNEITPESDLDVTVSDQNASGTIIINENGGGTIRLHSQGGVKSYMESIVTLNINGVGTFTQESDGSSQSTYRDINLSLGTYTYTMNLDGIGNAGGNIDSGQGNNGHIELIA
ncbi:Ig-like domain-containing protein [Galbibacter sp. BG1]